MSCNCKNNTKIDDLIIDKNETLSLFKLFFKYFFKVIGFLLFLILLPIINLFIIWFSFKMFVINKKIDFKPILLFIGKKFQNNFINNKFDEDDDFSALKNEELVILNVDDITNKKN